MATFPVVLDACVLVPAVLRDTLLYAAHLGLYRPHWSDEILDEVSRTLINRGFATAESAAATIASMRRAFPDACVAVPATIVAAMQVDPGDRHVAAAALVSDAKTIITWNIRHFPEIALAPLGIEAQHQDVFLQHQFWLSPDAMVGVLRQQHLKLRKPPATMEQVLTALAVFAPDFVDLVWPRLIPAT